MSFPPALSNRQWSDLHRLLCDTSAKLPKTGSYEPHYDATSWDLDDLYRAFREEALRSQSEVLPLVEAWESQGAWPRGKYKGKFWLRARIEEASAFVREIVEVPSNSAIRFDESLPTDARSVTRWLLYTRWDEQLADYWLSENLEFYTHLDDCPGGEEQMEEFHSWLSEVRNGRYLRK
jgi:hypothetical protein